MAVVKVHVPQLHSSAHLTLSKMSRLMLLMCAQRLLHMPQDALGVNGVGDAAEQYYAHAHHSATVHGQCCSMPCTEHRHDSVHSTSHKCSELGMTGTTQPLCLCSKHSDHPDSAINLAVVGQQYLDDAKQSIMD